MKFLKKIKLQRNEVTNSDDASKFTYKRRYVPEVVATQHDPHDVFSDVVYVALYRGHHHRAGVPVGSNYRGHYHSAVVPVWSNSRGHYHRAGVAVGSNYRGHYHRAVVPVGGNYK